MDPIRLQPASSAALVDTPPIVTSPILAAGFEAYHRDLPELLTTHPGWWVAYCGPERIEMARTHAEIYRLCERRPGLDWSVLLIGCVEPAHDWDYIDERPSVEQR